MGAPGGSSRPPGFTSESLPGAMRPLCTPAVFLFGPGCEKQVEEGGRFHQAASHASEAWARLRAPVPPTIWRSSWA